MAENIKINPEWKAQLQGEFTQPYMIDLREFLKKEVSAGKTIYPNDGDFFRAFDATPWSKVKVVILGQDPYHGEGQAHGLCFSVKRGVRPPPSLQNIFKEIKADINLPIPSHGQLDHWAEQGVLLLNTVLSVESGKAASHRGRGWEKFTDKVIEKLAQREEPVIFLLWGSFAHSKIQMIPCPPHYILKAPHPSPLSAYTGFNGCKHFSQTNEILRKLGKSEIDWSL